MQCSLRTCTFCSFNLPPHELAARAIIVIEPPPISPFIGEDLAFTDFEIIDERRLTVGADLLASWDVGITFHNHDWLRRPRCRDRLCATGTNAHCHRRVDQADAKRLPNS
jgi:hypothetical protein